MNEKSRAAGAINRPNLDWIISLQSKNNRQKNWSSINLLVYAVCVFNMVLSCNLPTTLWSVFAFYFSTISNYAPTATIHLFLVRLCCIPFFHFSLCNCANHFISTRFCPWTWTWTWTWTWNETFFFSMYVENEK